MFALIVSASVSQILLLYKLKALQVQSPYSGIESQRIEAERNYRDYLLRSLTQGQISCYS